MGTVNDGWINAIEIAGVQLDGWVEIGKVR